MQSEHRCLDILAVGAGELGVLAVEDNPVAGVPLLGASDSPVLHSPLPSVATTDRARPGENVLMDFSLLYFANRLTSEPTMEYDLLINAARHADLNEFKAVWMPERHFHAFGGAYPSPAITAAALTQATSNVRLRAGSVILPLHDVITVTEEWAVVDQLSGGRVDLSVAPGWSANDFVLAPDRFAERQHHLEGQISELRQLWSGASVRRVNGVGEEIDVAAFPRPAQPEIDLWLTCAQKRSSFEMAGRLGMNVLTALLFQNLDELIANIAAYRDASMSNGNAAGVVTLMLHAFVGADEDEVLKTVRPPFLTYLESSAELWQNEIAALSGARRRMALEFAFQRYWKHASLLGSFGRCLERVHVLAEAGVDEIAALIDFGVPEDAALSSLDLLNELRSRVTTA